MSTIGRILNRAKRKRERTAARKISKSNVTPQQSQFLIEAIESRLLLSADVIPVAATADSGSQNTAAIVSMIDLPSPVDTQALTDTTDLDIAPALGVSDATNTPEPAIGVAVQVNIPRDLTPDLNKKVTAKINISDAKDLESADIFFSYNPTDFVDLTEANIRLGTVLTGGTLVLNLNATGSTTTNRIVTIAAAVTIPRVAGAGSLIEIDFTLRDTASAGDKTIDLRSVSLSEDAIPVTPAPRPGDDPTDGIVKGVITNVNPVFTSTATPSVPENTLAVVTLAATDGDVPPQTLTFSISGGADQSKFEIVSGNQLRFVTAPNFEAPTDVGANNVYNVDVTVSDGAGGSAVQNLAVTVTAVNDNAPVITSNGAGPTAAVSINENTTAVTTVTATDADLPAQALTFSISGGADQSKFTINPATGVLAFVAAPDFEIPTDVGLNNVYDVVVQVSDGLLTDTQAIAVTVTAVNDNAPVITSNGAGPTAAVSINENTTAVTTVTATDADLPAQALTFSISGGADQSKFTINPTTGALAFVAAPDFEIPTDVGLNNVYDVVVQVSDGLLTDTQAIAVTVQDADDTNDNPVFTSTATPSVPENTLAVVTLAATDADVPPQTLSFSITGGADQSKFEIVSGNQLRFVTAPNFEAPTDVGANNVYNVDVTVSDGAGGSAVQNLAVTVTAVNDNAPVITSNGAGPTAAVSINENTTAVTTVTATDADLPAQALTFSISGGADQSKFTINPTTGALAFVAAPDFEISTDVGLNNVYDVVVQVSDGLLTDTQAIAVTVQDADDTNDNPVFTSTATPSVAENTLAVVTLAATDGDVPPQTLTFSISGGADQSKFQIVSGNQLRFVTAPNFEAPTDVGANNVYNVDVTVSDGAGGSAVQNLAVTVTAVNDNTPVITSNGAGPTAAVSINENTTAVTTVTATDADLPAQALTFSISGGADQSKFTINPTTGALAFVAAPDFEIPTDVGLNNVYDVVVQVSDGLLTDTQAIAVTVQDADDTNDNPVFTSTATPSVAENTLAVVTLAATDGDVPPQTLTFSISGGADQSKFEIVSGNQLRFVTAPNFEAPTDVGANNVYNVDVTVSDGAGGSAVQNLAVTVTAVNDNTPVITSNGAGPTAAVSINENTTAVTTVTATDADLPAQALTFSISGGADQSKFTINPTTGALAFVAAPDFEIPTDVGLNNVYDVVVQVSDGLLTDTQAIAVTVQDADDTNDNPVFTSTAAPSVPENTLAVVTLAATDGDVPPQTLTFSISGGADQSKFEIVSGNQLRFVTAPNFEAPTDVGANNVYNVDVTVSDGAGGSAVQNLAVTVTAVNDNTPVITSNGAGPTAAVSINENTTAVTTVTATDADLPAQALTFSISGGADQSKFTINPTTGALAFVAAPDFEIPTDVGLNNVYDVVVQVSDGLLTDTQAIAVTVQDADDTNDNPVFTSTATPSVAENTLAVVTLAATDGDVPAQTLTFSISGGADQSKFEIVSGNQLRFVTAPNFEAPTDVGANNVYNVDVTVSDGAGGSAVQNLAVTVTNVNEAPVVNAATFNVAENSANGTAAGTVVANDPDAGQTATLTYSITGGNTNGAFAINATTGAITVANSAALNFEATPSFSLTVQATDAGTAVLSGSNTITINLINQSNVDFVTSTLGQVVTFVSQAGTTIIATPVATPPGAPAGVTFPVGFFTFTLTGVTPGGNADVILTLPTDVLPNSFFKFGPEAGNATEHYYEYLFNGTTGATINANVVTLHLVDGGRGDFDLAANGSITDPGAPAIVTAIINNLPVANNDSRNSFNLKEDTALIVAVSRGVLPNDTDQDNDPLTAHLAGASAGGQTTNGGQVVLNANGSFTYTPKANFFGPDSFTYVANDGKGDSNIATVNVVVTPVNDAPVANIESYTTNQNTPLNVNATQGVLANDTDIDGNPLTAVLATNVAHGSLTLNANGSFSYTPTTNYSGPDSFTYRANDGTTNGNLATVFITVQQVAGAPILAPLTALGGGPEIAVPIVEDNSPTIVDDSVPFLTNDVTVQNADVAPVTNSLSSNLTGLVLDTNLSASLTQGTGKDWLFFTNGA